MKQILYRFAVIGTFALLFTGVSAFAQGKPQYPTPMPSKATNEVVQIQTQALVQQAQRKGVSVSEIGWAVAQTLNDAHEGLTHSQAFEKLAWIVGLDSLDKGTQDIFESIADYAYGNDKEYDWSKLAKGSGETGVGILSLIPVTKAVGALAKISKLRKLQVVMGGLAGGSRIALSSRQLIAAELTRMGESQLAQQVLARARRVVLTEVLSNGIRSQVFSFTWWGSVLALNKATNLGIPGSITPAGLALYGASQGCMIIANDRRLLSTRVILAAKDMTVSASVRAYRTVAALVDSIHTNFPDGVSEEEAKTLIAQDGAFCLAQTNGSIPINATNPQKVVNADNVFENVEVTALSDGRVLIHTTDQ